ncbi:MAG: hypothetical protein ACI89X_002525 [Planctomycetota bacterium]
MQSLRGVTLPDNDVIDFIGTRFILAHRNIEKDEHVGMSHGYSPSQSAVGTTNGAGPRNVQFLILAADATVLHALPGFWHPEDLIPELQLAFEINRLYLDEQKTYDQKATMYEMLHKSHMRRHGAEAIRRGQWQNFDRHVETSRVKREERDTFRTLADGKLQLKSVPEVIHDRMLARRFKKLDDFDLESFVDYGRAFYDNNHGEKGRSFSKAEGANRKRSTALAKKRKKEVREAARIAKSEERLSRRKR